MGYGAAVGLSVGRRTVIKQMTTRTLFVYGTLKEGRSLHGYIKDTNAKALGTAWTKGYKLYTNGYPVAVPTTSDEAIQGEIYKIPENECDIIDSIEFGAGYTLEWSLATLENGEEIVVELYVMDEAPPGWDYLKSGVF